MANLRRILLGRRLANEEGDEARISNPIALAVFSSDALSSVAYATGEIMAALAPYMALAAFGPAVIGQSWPVAVGIVLLLVILTVSYRQTIFAYPSGGGAYIVARENLGELPAQVAGLSSPFTPTASSSACSASSGWASGGTSRATCRQPSTTRSLPRPFLGGLVYGCS